MKSQSIYLVVLVVFGLLISNLSFAQKTEDRKVGSFKGVKIGGSFDVIIQEGASEGVKITASDINLEDIITEMRGDMLVIRTKDDKWNWRNSYKVDIVVTYKTLNSIVSSGSSSIVVKSTIKSDNFSLELSGSGKFKGSIEASELETSLSGSGDIELSGKASKQEISISGSGDIEALGMKTSYTKVSISGSGNAKVAVSESLEARITGSGDIRFEGNPSKQIIKSTGSGSIRKL